MSDRVNLLLELQKRAFRSSPWHSVMAALANVPEDVFFNTPSTHNDFPWMQGSIRDIVYHLAGDKLVQCSAAFENGATKWDNLTLTKSSTLEMMSELEAAHAVVENSLKVETDETLSRKVSSWGGKSMTAEQLFLMLIEHDFYHAGQIRYIRNLVESHD